jgi:hypothetical protein
MSSRRRIPARILGALLVAVLVLGATAVAAAAPTGYNTSGTDVRTIDLTTGTGPLLGPSGIGQAESFADIALSPTGVLYAITTDGSNGRLYTVNTSTGAATFVANLGIDPSNAGLTFTADGRLWMVQGASLYLVNTATGATTLQGTDPAGANSFIGLAGGCGTLLYAVRFPNADGELVRIDVSGATPTFTVVGPLGPAAATYNTPKVAFDAAGGLWGKNTNTPGTFTINLTSGTATLVSAASDGGPGLTIAAPACPPGPTPATPVLSGKALDFAG